MATIDINPQDLAQVRDSVLSFREAAASLRGDLGGGAAAAAALSTAVSGAASLFDKVDRGLGGGGLETRTRNILSGVSGGLQVAATAGLAATALAGPVVGAAVAAGTALTVGIAGAITGAQQQERRREVAAVTQIQSNLRFARDRRLREVGNIDQARQRSVRSILRRLRRGR